MPFSTCINYWIYLCDILDWFNLKIVHKWIPGHRDPKCRSITEKTILLLKMDEKFVPIAESGVEAIVGSEP